MRLKAPGALEEIFARAIERLQPPRPWALAVSGGPDSLALMHLAAERAARRGEPPPLVLTVDHGLRAEAQDEAERVVGWAGDLGLPSRLLRWRPPQGLKRIQEEARRARYALLGAACDAAGARTLMTAHTRDDQAETVAMRAARGGGHGLAGMPEIADLLTTFEPCARLVRPLLGAGREAVAAFAAARGLDPIRDPSNADPRFERVRLRRAGVAFDAAAHEAAVAARRRIEAEAARRLAEAEIDAHGALRTPRDVWSFEDAAADAALSAALRRVGGGDHPGSGRNGRGCSRRFAIRASAGRRSHASASRRRAAGCCSTATSTERCRAPPRRRDA